MFSELCALLINFLLYISSGMPHQHLILSISVTVLILSSKPAILPALDHSQAKLKTFRLFLSLLLIMYLLTIPSLPPTIFSVLLTVLFLLRYISLIIKFTTLMCIIQWFIMYSQDYAVVITNSITLK